MHSYLSSFRFGSNFIRSTPKCHISGLKSTRHAPKHNPIIRSSASLSSSTSRILLVQSRNYTTNINEHIKDTQYSSRDLRHQDDSRLNLSKPKDSSSSYKPKQSQSSKSNKSRAFDEEEEEDNQHDASSAISGLDSFAAKIHMGKPSGSAHDVHLTPIIYNLTKISETYDSAVLFRYLDHILEEYPPLKEIPTVRGRLLWSIVRNYHTKDALPLNIPPLEAKATKYESNNTRYRAPSTDQSSSKIENRSEPNMTPKNAKYSRSSKYRNPTEASIWCATHIATHWMHLERPGYLWGVFLDAVNKSEKVAEGDQLFSVIMSYVEQYPKEFEPDIGFILTARLSGLIDSFNYEMVGESVKKLVENCGTEIACWALVRSLGRSAMLHRPFICKLANWNNDVLPLKPVHYVTLLADVGLVELARHLWIKDNSQRLASGQLTDLEEESDIESEAKRKLDFEKAKSEMEHLRAGLLVFARYPNLEPPFDNIQEIILSRFKQLIELHPSLALHNHGLIYTLARSNQLELCEDLAKFCIDHGSPPAIVASALLRSFARKGDMKSYKYWLNIRGKLPSRHSDEKDMCDYWLSKSMTYDVQSLIDSQFPKIFGVPLEHIIYMDFNLRSRIYPNPAANGNEPGPAPAHPISQKDYQRWSKFIMNFKPRISRTDVHSLQAILFSFTVSGRWQDAEAFIFAPYRPKPANNDAMAAFLLLVYADLRMYHQLLSFIRSMEHEMGDDVCKILGFSKLVHLFNMLDEQPNSAEYIVEIWNALGHSSDSLLGSSVLPIVSKAAQETNNIQLLRNVWYGVSLAGIDLTRLSSHFSYLVELGHWLESNQYKDVEYEVKRHINRISRNIYELRKQRSTIISSLKHHGPKDDSEQMNTTE